MDFVVPIRPEEIPEALKCPICFGVPVVPVVTPCDHVFCHDCLYEAHRLAAEDRDARRIEVGMLTCPVCRKSSIAIRSLAEGAPLAYRIWNQIPVKCSMQEQGCTWTGAISDVANHRVRCALYQQKKTVENEDSIRLAQALAKVEELEREKQQLEQELRSSEEKLKTTSESLAKAQCDLDELNSSPRSKLDALFIPGRPDSYSFDRFKVVSLARLISRYLLTGPRQSSSPVRMIENNRIFNCVRDRYSDLEHGWKDNPPDYYQNVCKVKGGSQTIK